MPETTQILSLHSPAGSDVAIYKWPLHITETWNEAHEIAETVRWACSDFPELQTAMENCILSHFDPSSYESMKLFCEKYNRAVDNIRKLWSGRQPPPCIDVPPTEQHLKHILTQVYNRSIGKPEELNQYEPFSPEVYGETSFELIQEVISVTRMTENDVFLDLGSGVGQIVLQVAATVGCKCYGIEKAEIPAKYAEVMDKQFVKWMDFYGKSYGEYELYKGDFLDPKFDSIINSATVLFCNNFAFGPALNHSLKLKFQNLRDGVKIVSSCEFCPLNFRVTERKLSDIGAMMRVVQLSPLKGQVSWTGNPVTYYLHLIDRTKLEEFFLKQKHTGENKSEGSITPYSDDDESTSSSTDSSSEDSSLDSSNEDLFSHQRQELYHFPPPSTFAQHIPSTTTPMQLHKPHPQTLPSRRKSLTSTSAIGKKSTPPVGLTHVPHPPHPHVTQPAQHQRNKFPSGRGGRTRPQRKLGSRQPLIDQPSLEKLFESFQKQNEAYLQQLSSSQFQSWLNDAAEKEKMKRKHLLGVIDHLESEVTSLSQETIQSMKRSMLSLGITDLTPEGLLSGAKDIVSLNRQLRKEVQLLEKEVVQLKEQHQAMNNHHQLPPAQSSGGSLKVKDMAPPSSTPPTVTAHLTSTVASSSESPPINSHAPQLLPLTQIKREEEEMEVPTEEEVNPEEVEFQLLATELVEEAVSAEERIPELSAASKEYEIRLESIDQAVLELGPFAKEVNHQERLESISLDWPPDYIMKREKRQSYSPVSSGRGLPLAVGKATAKRGGRRRKDDTPTWNNATPLVHSSVSPSLSLSQPVTGGEESNRAPPTSRTDIPASSQSTNQEATIAEAMLALSHTPPAPPTHPNEERHASHVRDGNLPTRDSATPRSATTTPTNITRSTEEVTSVPLKVKPAGLPLSYSLPPLSKLPAPPSDTNGHQRSNSSSSNSYKSTGPVNDDSALSSPAAPYIQYDNRVGVASPVVRTAAAVTSSNPFLPPSLQSQATDSSVVSFPYPTFGWNPLYRPNLYSSLSYHQHGSVDPAPSLDSTALRSVISPYLLRYPYPSGGTPHVPLAGMTTAPSLPTTLTFHAPVVSSNATPLSAFKTLHAPYNRSLTPPTLHPLGMPTQNLDKTTPPTVAESLNHTWPFLGQYPTAGGVTFSPYTIFPSGGLPLTSYATLPSAMTLQAPPTGVQDIGETKKSSQRNRDSTTPLSQAQDNGYSQRLYQYPDQQETPPIINPLVTLTGGGVVSPNWRGGAKTDGKATPKLKIHQMNHEDFQLQEKGVGRHRKKKRYTRHPPIVMSSLPHERGMVTLSQEEDYNIDVTSIDPMPRPEDVPLVTTSLPRPEDVPLVTTSQPRPEDVPISIPSSHHNDDGATPVISTSDTVSDITLTQTAAAAVPIDSNPVLVTMAEAADHDIIRVDDEEMEHLSSEGTVSAVPSPAQSLSPYPSAGAIEEDITGEQVTEEKPIGESSTVLSVSKTPPTTPPTFESGSSLTSVSQAPPTSPVLISGTPPTIEARTSPVCITSSNDNLFMTPPISKIESPPTFHATVCESTSSELVIDEAPPTQSEAGSDADQEETGLTNQIAGELPHNDITDREESPIIDIGLINYDNELSLRITSSSPPAVRSHTPPSEEATPTSSPQPQSWSEFQERVSEGKSSLSPTAAATSEQQQSMETASSLPAAIREQETDHVSSDQVTALISQDSLISSSDDTAGLVVNCSSSSAVAATAAVTVTNSTSSSHQHKKLINRDFSINKLSTAHTEHSSSSRHSSTAAAAGHKTKEERGGRQTSRHSPFASRHSDKTSIRPHAVTSSNSYDTPIQQYPHCTTVTSTATTNSTSGSDRSSSGSGSKFLHKSTTDVRSNRHRSPKTHPFLPTDKLSPPTSLPRHGSTHHRRRHTPTDSRHHKRSSHAPRSHHDSGRNHHHHSHSTTPVTDAHESGGGRGLDKSHTYHKEGTPSWNSDEESRVWSHHHGDRSGRKRRGSEGCDEHKYKKTKHKHHHTHHSSDHTHHNRSSKHYNEDQFVNS